MRALIITVIGYASTADRILALSHDYAIIRSDCRFLYLSETDIGLVILNFFLTIVKSKVSGRAAMWDVVLARRKITAVKAKEVGMVDRALEDVEAMVRLAEELATRGWDGGMYMSNQMAMLPEVCAKLRLSPMLSSKL